MLPMAALYQTLFDSGFDTFIHLVLAAGSLLIASAVFDFSKVAKWINWAACLFVGAEAAIFLLQGVSHLIQNDSLTYIAYQVLGQWVEARIGDLFVLWCVALLLVDSRGKTRVLGFVAVSIVVCFEVYKYSLAYLGDAPAEGLKALFLLLFVWLLFESKKTISLETMDDDGIGPNVPQIADDSLPKMGIGSPAEGTV
jgi:hypothetical protein